MHRESAPTASVKFPRLASNAPRCGKLSRRGRDRSQRSGSRRRESSARSNGSPQWKQLIQSQLTRPAATGIKGPSVRADVVFRVTAAAANPRGRSGAGRRHTAGAAAERRHRQRSSSKHAYPNEHGWPIGPLRHLHAATARRTGDKDWHDKPNTRARSRPSFRAATVKGWRQYLMKCGSNTYF